MTFRSRKFLNLAHTCTLCCADFPHQCVGYQGCEPAHSDSSLFGRGMRHKSADWAVAFICHNAHVLLTAKVNDDMDRETKFYHWLRAFARTQDYLWENGKLKVTP